MRTWIALLLIPSFSYASCELVDVVNTLRPNSQWVGHGNTYSGIVWLDTSTAKPTQLEVANAISTCKTNATNRLALKQQARLDVKNTALTLQQRLQALLILQDLDQ